MRRALHLPSRISVTTRPEDLAIHFRLALEEMRPASVKFGQILSTRPDLLPLEYSPSGQIAGCCSARALRGYPRNSDQRTRPRA